MSADEQKFLKEAAEQALKRQAEVLRTARSDPNQSLGKAAKLPLEADADDVLDLVREWIELLAQERYEEAFALTYHPPDDHLTPELLKMLVANYGFVEPLEDGRTFRVTSLRDGDPGGPPHPSQGVSWFGNAPRLGLASRIGHAHFDLPLNGEWSDVTAIFDILEFEDEIVLRLLDLHVM